jgi:hypothetical protein
LFSSTWAGCLGPGVEPPESGGSAPIAGAGAAQGGDGGTGVGAAGSAGVGGFMNAGTGGLSPMAGAGGGSGEGGAAGMEVGGFGGMTGMAGTGGTGGTGGLGAGQGGAGGGAGAADGGTEPEAPILECEEGRDNVMLLEAGLSALFPYCAAQLPSEASLGTPTMVLAVTSLEQGSSMETTWAGLKEGADECDDGQAFYVDATLDAPHIRLCPAFCEALIATGIENVKLELIYGCDPPE